MRIFLRIFFVLLPSLYSAGFFRLDPNDGERSLTESVTFLRYPRHVFSNKPVTTSAVAEQFAGSGKTFMNFLTARNIVQVRANVTGDESGAYCARVLLQLTRSITFYGNESGSCRTRQVDDVCVIGIRID